MNRICPNCGAMVRAGASFCGICRQPLTSVSGPVPGGASPSASMWGSGATAYLQAEDGRRFPLVAMVTRIGRDPSVEVSLSDGQVSGRHAEVEQDAGGYRLRDLGSTNGTYLNNQRIIGDCCLSDGDVILVGSTRLTFDLRGTSSAALVSTPGTQAVSPTALQSLLSGASPPQVPAAPPQAGLATPGPGWQQPAQQPPPAQQSRGFWDTLVGPRVVGRVPFEPKEAQEQPPFDFSRMMVMLVVLMSFLTALGAFIAAVMTVAIILVCVGAGALLFIVPFLFTPLQMMFSGAMGWLKDQKPLTVIRFRIEDDLTGRPVDVVLRRKMGEGGGVYQNDCVQVWGSLKGGILYASKVRVEGSGAKIRAQNPWPLWIGLLALAGMAGQIYYLITLIEQL